MAETETETETETEEKVVEERPTSTHRRLRNVGRKIRFDPNDNFVWNRSIQIEGVWVAAGSPVEKEKVAPHRLKRLYNLDWIISARHPRHKPEATKPEATKPGGES